MASHQNSEEFIETVHNYWCGELRPEGTIIQTWNKEEQAISLRQAPGLVSARTIGRVLNFASGICHDGGLLVQTCSGSPEAMEALRRVFDSRASKRFQEGSTNYHTDPIGPNSEPHVSTVIQAAFTLDEDENGEPCLR